MLNYEVLEDGYIVKTDGEIINVIPPSESNSDYQRYLRWLENPDADETQGGIN